MNKITVYTTEGCDYCKTIKTMLNESNIEFEEISAKDNEEKWHRVVRITGLGTFPTFEIGDEFYVPGRDYGSPEQFVNFLKNYVEPDNDYPIELQLMQSFKTMAFSINQGINRILQELKKIEDEHKSTS